MAHEFERERGVIDLFSCGGGMSAGFSGRPGWRLLAAVDLEIAKPSGRGAGETQCNDIYEANHGLRPFSEDILSLDPEDLMARVSIRRGELACLISCAPCTDFSRANPQNHLVDGDRNSLIGRSGDFVEAMLPDVFIMENARELLKGNYAYHWTNLRRRLERLGYDVSAEVHFLNRFGLPQIRERALVIASRVGPARSLEDVWTDWEIDTSVSTVRTALSRLDFWRQTRVNDQTGNSFPGMTDPVRSRIEATPEDGGGWVDVARSTKTRDLLTPDCLRRWQSGDLGSHPDVYGRMWWDRPAPTVKRECAHLGNGRYGHPKEDRLLSVREMATLQGFPFTYTFPIKSISNRYRAIGDAVPPLIAWQIASCADWMLSGRRPDPAELVMPNTSLRSWDIQRQADRRVA